MVPSMNSKLSISTPLPDLGCKSLEEGILLLSKLQAHSWSDVGQPSNLQPAVEFEDSSAACPLVLISEMEGGVDEQRVSTLNKPVRHSELFAIKYQNQPTFLPSDKNEGEWSTVTCKCKGCGSTACITINVVSPKSMELTCTLSEVECSLTGKEHLCIQRREQAKNEAQLLELESLLKEGLLQSKGKRTVLKNYFVWVSFLVAYVSTTLFWLSSTVVLL